MKKPASNQLTSAQQEELHTLAALPDEQINTEDAPELPDWHTARRGLFFRPVKQQITLRLDADLIAWFKARNQGKRYQTRMNHALREYVTQHMLKGAKSQGSERKSKKHG